MLDEEAVEAMEKRFVERQKVGLLIPAAEAASPAGVVDTEESPAQFGLAESIGGHDPEAMAESYPTAQCLRPDEVALGARDEEGLSSRALTHLRACEYCKSMVAMAHPHAARYASLRTRLSAIDDEVATLEMSATPTIVERTRTFFSCLDKVSGYGMGTLQAATLCALVIYFIPHNVPNGIALFNHSAETSVMTSEPNVSAAHRTVLAKDPLLEGLGEEALTLDAKVPTDVAETRKMAKLAMQCSQAWLSAGKDDQALIYARKTVSLLSSGEPIQPSVAELNIGSIVDRPGNGLMAAVPTVAPMSATQASIDDAAIAKPADALPVDAAAAPASPDAEAAPK